MWHNSFLVITSHHDYVPRFDMTECINVQFCMPCVYAVANSLATVATINAFLNDRRYVANQ